MITWLLFGPYLSLTNPRSSDQSCLRVYRGAMDQHERSMMWRSLEELMYTNTCITLSTSWFLLLSYCLTLLPRFWRYLICIRIDAVYIYISSYISRLSQCWHPFGPQEPPKVMMQKTWKRKSIWLVTMTYCDKIRIPPGFLCEWSKQALTGSAVSMQKLGTSFRHNFQQISDHSTVDRQPLVLQNDLLFNSKSICSIVLLQYSYQNNHFRSRT